MACFVECSCDEQTLGHANACDEDCLGLEIAVPTTGAAPDALPCSIFIAEERPGDIADEEEECREREE